MEKMFCYTCNKEENVTLMKVKKKYDVKGGQVETEINILLCERCGQEIYDEKIERENEIVVYDSYKKKTNLLMSNEIKRIRESYGLSQKSFANLIGFGEKTITRYENGTIQDESHNLIMRLMGNLDFFKQTWNIRKSVLSKKENENIKKILVRNKELYSTYYILEKSIYSDFHFNDIEKSNELDEDNNKEKRQNDKYCWKNGGNCCA